MAAIREEVKQVFWQNFFYPDGADGEFFSEDECQKVKAQAAEIRQRIGPVEEFCFWFSQSLVYIENKIVHVVGGLVAVII